MKERELLTIPQAALLIGMSRAVLWRHVQKDHIGVERVGKYVLIDADELARFQVKPRRPGRPRKPLPPAI